MTAGMLELPLRLARGPMGTDLDLYPSTVRSLLASWHALRLERYLIETRQRGEGAAAAPQAEVGRAVAGGHH